MAAQKASKKASKKTAKKSGKKASKKRAPKRPSSPLLGRPKDPQTYEHPNALDPTQYRGMTPEEISAARGVSYASGRRIWRQANRGEVFGAGKVGKTPHLPRGGKLGVRSKLNLDDYKGMDVDEIAEARGITIASAMRIYRRINKSPRKSKAKGWAALKEEAEEQAAKIDGETEYPRGGVPAVMRGVMTPAEQYKRYRIVSDDPNFPIDLEDVERFASIGCTVEELAMFAGVTVDALLQRLHRDRAFHNAYKQGWLDVRRALRRTQLRVALEGDTRMLIWLGKQILGQQDVHHFKTPGAGAGGIPPLPKGIANQDEQLRALLQNPEARAEMRSLLSRLDGVDPDVVDAEKVENE